MHVEDHRTIGLVISPYVKRSLVDHTHYTMASTRRTMELIVRAGARSLGCGPGGSGGIQRYPPACSAAGVPMLAPVRSGSGVPGLAGRTKSD